MERRIIQDTPKPEVKEEPTIREYSDDEIGIVHTPQTAEEAMSATEEQFLAFVNAQIEKMDKKLLFWGESSPPLAVLNKALMDHSHVLLALTSLYENARIQVSKAKEEYEEWHAIKFIEVRTEVNRDELARNKWYSEKEIEYMIRTKYRAEMAQLKAAYELAESQRSMLQRMIDGWSSYQFILVQLSKNSIAESYSTKDEGYIDGYTS